MTGIEILEHIIADDGECVNLDCKKCPLMPLSGGWLCSFHVFSFSQREQLLETAKTKLTQLVLDKMLKGKG